ncbi:unnamed protein product [Amoebophrya sp. A120]|nr:unnamed protein product [Amoebophrya sp. A120]|eukprot:GSA120T00000071001.1
MVVHLQQAPPVMNKLRVRRSTDHAEFDFDGENEEIPTEYHDHPIVVSQTSNTNSASSSYAEPVLYTSGLQQQKGTTTANKSATSNQQVVKSSYNVSNRMEMLMNPPSCTSSATQQPTRTLPPSFLPNKNNSGIALLRKNQHQGGGGGSTSVYNQRSAAPSRAAGGGVAGATRARSASVTTHYTRGGVGGVAAATTAPVTEAINRALQFGHSVSNDDSDVFLNTSYDNDSLASRSTNFQPMAPPFVPSSTSKNPRNPPPVVHQSSTASLHRGNFLLRHPTAGSGGAPPRAMSATNRRFATRRGTNLGAVSNVLLVPMHGKTVTTPENSVNTSLLSGASGSGMAGQHVVDRNRRSPHSCAAAATPGGVVDPLLQSAAALEQALLEKEHEAQEQNIESSLIARTVSFSKLSGKHDGTNTGTNTTFANLHNATYDSAGASSKNSALRHSFSEQHLQHPARASPGAVDSAMQAVLSNSSPIERDHNQGQGGMPARPQYYGAQEQHHSFYQHENYTAAVAVGVPRQHAVPSNSSGINGAIMRMHSVPVLSHSHRGHPIQLAMSQQQGGPFYRFHSGRQGLQPTSMGFAPASEAGHEHHAAPYAFPATTFAFAGHFYPHQQLKSSQPNASTTGSNPFETPQQSIIPPHVASAGPVPVHSKLSVSLQESQQTVLEAGAGAQHQAPPPVPTSHFSTLQFQPTIVPQHPIPRSPSAAAAASLAFPIVVQAAAPVASRTGTAPRMVEDHSVVPPVVVKTRNHDFLNGKPMQLPTSTTGNVVVVSSGSRKERARAVVVPDRGRQEDDQNVPEEQLGNSNSTLPGGVIHIPTKELAVVERYYSSEAEARDEQDGEHDLNGDREDVNQNAIKRDAADHDDRDVLHKDPPGRVAENNKKMNLAAVLLEEEFNNTEHCQLAGGTLQQPEEHLHHQGLAQHHTNFEIAPLDEKENSKELREAAGTSSSVSSATFSKAVKLPAMNQFCFYQEPPPCVVAASGTTSSEHIHFSDEIALPLPENLVQHDDCSSSSSIVSNSEMVKNNILISIPVPVELGDSEKEEQEGESEDPRHDLGAEVRVEVVHDIEECNKNLLRNHNASGVVMKNASSVSGVAGGGGGTITSSTQGQCNYTATVGAVQGDETEKAPFAAPAQQDRREDGGIAGNYKGNKFVVDANKNSGTSDKKQNAIRINAPTTRTRVQSPTTAAAGSWTPSVAKERFVPQHTQDQYFEQTLRSPTSTPSNLTPGFGTNRSSKANHSRAAGAVPAFNNTRSRRASSVDKLVADRVEQEDLAPPTPTSTSEREMKATTTSTTTTERIKQNAKPVLVKISLSKQIEKSAKLRNQLEQQLVEIERLKQKTEDCRAEFAKRVKHLTRGMAQLRKDLLTTPNRKRTNEKSLAELNRQKRDAEEGVVAAVKEWESLERREREVRARLQSTRTKALSAIKKDRESSVQQERLQRGIITPANHNMLFNQQTYLFNPEEREDLEHLALPPRSVPQPGVVGGSHAAAMEHLRALERNVIDNLRPAFGVSIDNLRPAFGVSVKTRRLPSHPSPTTAAGAHHLLPKSLASAPSAGSSTRNINSRNLRSRTPSPHKNARSSSCSAEVEERSTRLHSVGNKPEARPSGAESEISLDADIHIPATTSAISATADPNMGAENDGTALVQPASVLSRLESALAAAESKLQNSHIFERIANHRKKWR